MKLLYRGNWSSFQQRLNRSRLFNTKEEVLKYIFFIDILCIVPPRISPFAFEDEITEGMRTQIMCSSSQGDQPFNITWYRNNVIIQSNSGVRMGKQLTMMTKQGDELLPQDPSLTINHYTPFSSILSIHNVSSWHNGNYTCSVANHAGTVEYTAVLSVSGKSSVTIVF